MVAPPPFNGDVPRADAIRTDWTAAKPKRNTYADLIQELNMISMIGKGRVFSSGPHVSATHMIYLKLHGDTLYTKMKLND